MELNFLSSKIEYSFILSGVSYLEVFETFHNVNFPTKKFKCTAPADLGFIIYFSYLYENFYP
jgi:hypothetical protein